MALSSDTRTRSNVTREQTSFVGRQAEVSTLARLARAQSLITVVGPPGIGKTRVTREWALRTIADEPASEIWTCDLSQASSVGDVVSSIARVLGIDVKERDPVKDLADALEERAGTWLILDNAEGALPALSEVAQACLTSSAQIRFVVTSREALDSPIETLLELAPLPHGDAVALFNARARAVRPESATESVTRDAIDRILDRIDAVPLAIELAAGRLAILSVSQVADRVEDGLDVLRASQGKGGRHESLERAIDDSWGALTELERDVATQCSVFRAGFTLDAAAKIVLRRGLDLPDALDRLRTRSLLRVDFADSSAEPRFRFYESVRMFVRKRVDAGTLAVLRARHAAYFADRAEREPPRVDWARDEFDNLVAATEDSPDPRHSAIAALALDPLVRVRGAADFHRTLLERARKQAELSGDPGIGLRVLLAEVEFHHAQGSMLDAYVQAQAACAAAKEKGPSLVSRALYLAGLVARDFGRAEEAIALWEEALCHPSLATDIATRLALPPHYAYLKSNPEALRAAVLTAKRESFAEEALIAECALGVLMAEMGKGDEAGVSLGRVVEAARALRGSNRRLMALTLSFAAAATLVRGDASLALSWFMEAARAHRDVGNRLFVVFAHAYVGLIRFQEGLKALPPRSQWTEQIVSLREDVEEARRTGNPFPESYVIAVLGVYLAACGETTEGRKCTDAAAALVAGWAPPPYALFIEAMAAVVGLFEADNLPEMESDRLHAEANRVLAAHGALLASRSKGVLVGRTSELESGVRTLRAVQKHERDKSAVSVAAPMFSGTVTIGEDADWFEVDGQRIDLGRRWVLKQILEILANERAKRPNEVLRGIAIAELVWPTLKNVEALNNRLHNAIATLRQLGLKKVLVTKGDGYLLDPSYGVVRAAKRPSGLPA